MSQIPEIGKNERVLKLKNLIKEFQNYQFRINILDEVIIDQKLLFENPPWELVFIVDFCQLYNVAYPDLVKKKIDFGCNNSTINISIKFPDENEKRKIFRDRMRNAIPFFARIKLKEPPLLIPPYQKELFAKIRSPFERMIRKNLISYIYGLRNDIKRLRKKWLESVNDLKSVPDVNENNISKKEIRSIVDKFSKLTIDSFYILSLTNTVGDKNLNFLLTDKYPSNHLKFFEKEEYSKIHNNINPTPWYNKLCEIRKNVFSNSNDAEAISAVLKLNEIANLKGEKKIYLLLSDAESFKKIINDEYKNNSAPISLTSLIKNDKFPSYCQNRFTILRTSYHFEEFILTFDTNKEKHIRKLENRRQKLLKEIGIISPQINESEKICSEHLCPCSYNKNCDILIDEIGKFIKTEEETSNLENILHKHKVFEPLLHFINNYIEKDISDKVSELLNLGKEYNHFFSEQYTDDILNKLESNLEKLEGELFKNTLSVMKAACIADKSIMEIKNSLRRLETINFKLAFSQNSKIRYLIEQIFTENENQKYTIIKNRKWYQNLFEIILLNEDDVESTLLSIMLLYCNEYYYNSYWMSKYWIESKIKKNNENNKRVEFHLLMYSSAIRLEFSKKDKFLANYKIKSIIEKLRHFSELKVNSQDPRIPHLIGKTYARMFQNGMDDSLDALNLSIFYTNKALNILDSLFNSINNFNEIKIPLENNLLWCSSKIALFSLDNNLPENIYNKLIKYTDKPYIMETCASYTYANSFINRKSNIDKSKILFEEALGLELYALKLSVDQNINAQELKYINNTFENWCEEYKSNFNDTIFLTSLDLLKDYSIPELKNSIFKK